MEESYTSIIFKSSKSFTRTIDDYITRSRILDVAILAIMIYLKGSSRPENSFRIVGKF